MSISRVVREIRFYADPVILIQAFFPTFMLLLFLIAPLLDVLLIAVQYSIVEVFRDPTYFSTTPQGTLVFISRVTFRGKEITLIKLQGVSFGAIPNSLINAIVVTCMASLLGVVVAFVMARYDFPGKTAMRILATVPLLMTPFINTFVIKKLTDWKDGLISYVISDVLGLPYRIGVESIAGVALAQIMTFFPIVYLNVYSSMVNIDPSLEEQAENLGAKGFKLFRTVTLPLSAPGLAAGAAIVFIFSLEDVAAPIVFNEKRFISYQIFSKFIEATTGQLSPVAATMALILLLLALSAFVGIKRYVALKQYAMISRGGRWKPRVSRPGTWKLLVIYLVLLPMLAFFAFPQIGVFLYAFSKVWRGALPEGFTLENLGQIVADPVVARAVVNSLVYSLCALVFILLMGLSAAYVLSLIHISEPTRPY